MVGQRGRGGRLPRGPGDARAVPNGRPAGPGRTAYEPHVLWEFVWDFVARRDFVTRRGGGVPDPQRRFVEAWSRRVTKEGPDAVTDGDRSRSLVEDRERQLKGARAPRTRLRSGCFYKCYVERFSRWFRQSRSRSTSAPRKVRSFWTSPARSAANWTTSIFAPRNHSTGSLANKRRPAFRGASWSLALVVRHRWPSRPARREARSPRRGGIPGPSLPAGPRSGRPTPGGRPKARGPSAG